jgi:hypothetical protein
MRAARLPRSGLIYTRYLNPLPSSTRMTAAGIRRTLRPRHPRRPALATTGRR